MRALFCIKANYYRFLSKLPHFEREHVVSEPDGVSFYRVYFILMRDIFRNQYIQRAPQGVALVC